MAMKITMEIPDDEILEAVKDVVTKRVADEIMSEYRSPSKYCYKTVIKECVRDAIKKDIDNLSDRAVVAAGKSIENRAVKKLIGKLESEL